MVQSKQEQLRLRALQLNSELAALKQVRQRTGLPAAKRGALHPPPVPSLPTRCAPSVHPHFRIAMLMPWVSSPASKHSLPAWLPFLATTAARSALLVDWLLFHEGAINHPIARARVAGVRFIDLGRGGIASLIGARLSEALSLPPANKSLVVARIKFMIQKWPRLVAEYKPTFGSVFEAYLGNYSHWGYSDFDIVCGQLPRFIEWSELVDFHVVTYSFGDNEAIYLRGQWTVHANSKFVNRIWMGCKHLGKGLQAELYQKMAWARHFEAQGKKSYHKRFLSAEGCYSYEALHTRGLRVKVANKQFVGLERTGEALQDVFVLGGSLWMCSRGRQVDLRALAAAGGLACDLGLPGVQRASGEREAFQVTQEGCGAWMPQEFRMCAAHLKGRGQQNVVIEDGQFYTQKIVEATELSAEEGQCKQGAFFHMQEWKKRWGENSFIHPKAAYNAFHLSPNGFFPLPTKHVGSTTGSEFSI